LLDAVTDYLPSPLDVNSVQAKLESEDEIIEIRPDIQDEFCALIFKIVSDRHVGKLAFARVYSGTVKSGCFIYNSSRGQRNVLVDCLKCTPTTVKRSVMCRRRYCGHNRIETFADRGYPVH
jgi:elongation factor G